MSKVARRLGLGGAAAIPKHSAFQTDNRPDRPSLLTERMPVPLPSRSTIRIAWSAPFPQLEFIQRPHRIHKLTFSIFVFASSYVAKPGAADYVQTPGHFGGFGSDGSVSAVADDSQVGQEMRIGGID